MSEFRVDTITDRAGTGSPNFPNGLTLNGLVPVSNTPAWSETGTAPSALATENRIINYNRGGKNIIINGNMNVHQRSGTTVSSISTSGYYTADRWYTDASTASTSAVFSQLVDATDFPVNSEFRKCLKTTCTTAKASLAVGDYVKVVQKIEGQNVQVLKKGTTAAETMTLSFWVESGVTGTYICELVDLQNSRQISKAYTISSSGVWEQKTINFPSDTTGTLTNDTSSRFEVSFWLAAGLTYTGGTLNNSSWASFTNANRAAGQVNLASATNNFWNLTGVQLEIGSIANPFEYKSYSEQLSLCQRYYISYAISQDYTDAFNAGVIYRSYSLPVPMRIAPNISIVSQFTYFSSATGTNFTPTFTSSINSVSVLGTSLTNGRGLTGGTFAANSELT
jgi:hypothetical protein